MRSIKKGPIRFGLVGVGVRMYTATESHDIEFHTHHAGCLGAIRQLRKCETCGEIVEYHDIVSGREVNGRLVTVTKDEQTALEEEAGSGFEVLEFVHRSEIDPIMFEATYYLEPEDPKSKANVEGYALLRTVLAESDRVGIVEFTYRQRTRTGVLRVLGDNTLAIHTMRWIDEVRPTDELKGVHEKVELNPKFVKTAHAVLESMLGEFEPEQYVDTYRDRLSALLDAKAADAPYVAAPAEQATEDVSDLLAALEASIKRHPAGKKRARKAPAKKKVGAA